MIWFIKATNAAGSDLARDVPTTRTIQVRLILPLACAVLAAAPAAAEPASTYTRIDYKRCRVVSQQKDGAHIRRDCPGFAGVRVAIDDSDDRMTLGFPKLSCVGGFGKFNEVGQRIEWRHENGKPFAAIARFSVQGDEQKKRSWLVVHSVGTRSCPIAYVAGDLSDANAAARRAADASTGTRFVCGNDEPKLITPAGEKTKLGDVAYWKCQ